jgi:GAF domain-containing protein
VRIEVGGDRGPRRDAASTRAAVKGWRKFRRWLLPDDRRARTRRLEAVAGGAPPRWPTGLRSSSRLGSARPILFSGIGERGLRRDQLRDAVIRLRPDDRVQAVAVRGSHFDALLLREWSQPAGDGLIGRCLRARTPVRVNDVYADPDYSATPETTEVRAELVVPLIVEGELWGALNVGELQPDAFDDDDVILLSTLATQVVAALRASALVARVRELEAAAAPALAALS